MHHINIKIISKNEFKTYENNLKELFEKNSFKNGGMLYSDDFIINSDFMIIADLNNEIVAYMAICKLTEKELDRKYETYQEEPVLEKSLLIKHLVVSEKYRRQHIATKLFEHLKSYAINNKIDYLYLWTTLDNKVALEFYKKRGFYKMGDFYPDDGTFQGLNGFHSVMMASNTGLINKIKFLNDATKIEQDFRGHSRALRYIFEKNNQKYFIKIYNNNRIQDLSNSEETYQKTKIPTARTIEKEYLEEINKTYVVYEYIEGKTLKQLTKELEIDEIEKIGNKVGNYLARFMAIKGNTEDVKNSYELEFKKLIDNLYFMKNQYEDKTNKKLAPIDLERLYKNFLEYKEYVYKVESSFIHGDINLSNVIVKNGETYFIDTDGGKFSFRSLDFRGNCWYGWDGYNKEKEQAMYRGIYKGLFDGNIPDEFNKELAFTIIYEFLLKVYEPNKTGDLEKLEYTFNKFYDIFVRANYFENYKFEWFNSHNSLVQVTSEQN